MDAFKKKASQSEESTRKSILKDKQDNYKFLLLVQGGEYEQAYKLGRLILKTAPNNPSIAKFCAFIEQNQTQLKQMVEQERQAEQYQTESSQQDENNEQEGTGSEYSEFSESAASQSEQQSTSKQKNKKCDVHQWPHICKNQNCPNKNKGKSPPKKT